jgi:hypothetical protein
MGMATGTGSRGNKYERQSWPADSLEGMPPKRKRLVVWAFLWLFLLSWLLDLGLEAAGIPQPWRSVLIGAALAAVLIPLIRAAATETRELRAEGIDPLPHSPVTRKTLIFVSVFTVVLWIGFAGLVITTGGWVFPLTPILCTIWLAFQLHRRRTTPRRA